MILISDEKRHFISHLSLGLLCLLQLTECEKIGLVGPSRCAGRVEVYYQDTWGTVCDDQWSLKNAEVVCRELNCGTAMEAKKGAFFGQGKDEIWLDDVQCIGHESSILKCQHRPFGQNNCDHNKDVGVICSEHVRFVNGTARCNGRVEVFHEGNWKRVCSDWGKETAQAVCREAGCGDPVTQTETLYFGEAHDLFGVKLTCCGNETSVSQCSLLKVNGSCDDATVTCGSRQPIRLVNGTNRCSGRVEIYHKEQWGTVCDNKWGIQEATVACREMNCGNALEVKHKAYFGRGQGQIWLDDIECTGHEKSLAECPHTGFGEHDCDHSEDAGLVCSETVRLINGTDGCSGRVEVFHNNQWGKVCKNNWGLKEATVVCKELSCGVPKKSQDTFYFGDSSLQGFTSRCSGNVRSISQCQLQEHTGSCEGVSLACAELPPLRLVNGTNRCSGRVEIMHDGQWGTVCDDEWDFKDAQVVCRAMDCGPLQTAKSGAFFGEGQGVIWLDDVNCLGNETSLEHCQPRSFGDSNCQHGEDAGVICSAIRLINGTDMCSGRVEVHHGEHWSPALNVNWGMSEATVVCREMNCGDPVKLSGSFGQGEDLRGYEIHCNGGESSLTQCTFGDYTRSITDHIEEASVVCSGNVRLTGGSTRCDGRVEYFDKDQWGTVCAESWDMKNATVVCRQLGCGRPHKFIQVGPGTGQTWADQIECDGMESTLTQCPQRRFTDRTCNNPVVVGVFCTGSLTVRLVNGNNECSGRVEVRHGNQWQTVCDTDWTLSKAEVVCESVDCGRAISAHGGAFFGQGSGSVVEASNSCFSNVTSLQQCSVNGFTRTTCEHEHDAGVLCADIPPLRLVNGTDRCSGRVEILHHGQWGTVCDDEWDFRDAQVVCRAMDCGPPQTAKSGIFFGEGQGVIWLDDVNCLGNETSLEHCQHPSFGDNNCRHGEDAGVMCSAIRLINGTDMCSGRVEVHHGEHWSPAFNVNWGMSEATVVCREMNCGDPVKISGSFGQGGGLRGYEIHCNGGESSVRQCTFRDYTRSVTEHIEEASVVCSGNVRLTGGSTRCDGRVEYFDKDQWGTVCAESWDMKDATVMCRQLDCGRPHKLIQLGPGTGQTWTDQIECNGMESTLTQCPQKPFPDRTCNNTVVAGVFCTGSLTVQLVNGNDECSGRVEVRHGNQWQTVCDTDWTLSKAEVVCESLECGRAVSAHGEAFFGRGSGPVVEASNLCFNNVTSLQQCSVNGFTRTTCEHEHDAGVLCAGGPPLRLVNGPDRCSGRVEILHYSRWGTVCSDEWDFRDAQVVCRAMDCGPPQAAKSGAFFGEGKGVIWLDDVNCLGNETSLMHCQQSFFGRNNCGHGEDAGVICSAVRLINGTDMCSGRVEVHRGEHWSPAFNVNWGMSEATVVCRDMNCGDPVKLSGSFGQGEDLRGYEIHCTGVESSVRQCTFRDYTRSITDHIEEASVVCSGLPPLRLMNGTDRCSGRVEILHHGQWGTVCDDQWDFRDAQVVCRAMDCGPPQAFKSGAFFGEGQGVIWLDDMNCLGNETSLVHCQHPSFGDNNCGHGEDAGVICSAIRLINGTDMCSGRVEVHHGEHWSPAFIANWGMSEATVVCREMNCGDPVKLSGSFGQGEDLRGYEIHCNGGESSLTQCTFGDYTRSITDHIEEASVVCSELPPLRLMNGTDRCSGRVEILHHGQWGTVCDDQWDFRDAQVVCRAMDCGPPQAAKSGAFFGEGQGVIWLDDMNCLGNETSLVHCQHPSFGDNNCGHGEDAGVICSAIRLINGTDMCSGRVEVHHGEQWSPAFNINWGMSEATVVCREMNCGDPVKLSGSFGQGEDLRGYEIHCNGGESSLTQCTFGDYTRSITDHIEEASVVCSELPPLRLANGLDRCSGRVEILHDGQWGTVCDDEWDFRDAQVVCRAMDCGPPQTAKSGAFFGEGQGLIWLDDVNCLGNETSLVHCQHRSFGDNNCGHDEDAGVICSAIRLINGTDMCSGRVEVHRGEHWSPAFNINWGMSEATVVCREMNCGDPVKFSGSFGQGEDLRGYEIHCNGGESSLTQCTFGDYTRSITDLIEEASVVCSGHPPLRLVNGPDRCSGRVEILHNDQWGTVCDDEWDFRDAQVVCRAMDCGPPQTAKSGAFFGEGQGVIWLDDVNCLGNETSLVHCQHRSFGDNNCRHGEDAGVICSAI